MHKITASVLSAALLAFAMYSCEDIVDVELNSVEPVLVIEGVVRLDEKAEVLITRTKDFGEDNTYEPVTSAVVTISDDAGNSEQLVSDASGRYVGATITGTERRTYRLSVSCEGEEYTAISRMPPRVEMDSITQWWFPLLDYPEPMVHFVDPPGEENQYYRFVVSINGKWPNLEKRLISTEFVDGNNISQVIFLRYDDGNDDEPISNGNLLTLEMRCLDKGTYTFFNTLDMIDSSLANPTSNITGGALGYFGAYSYTQSTVSMRW